MPLTRSPLIAIVLVAILPSGPALAQAPTSEPAAPARSVITRKDMAEGFLRVERALAVNPPASAEERARIHREMDTAAYHFFSSNFAESLRQLNELAGSIRRDGAREPQSADVIRSLKLRLSPPIALATRPSVFTARLFHLYDVPIEQPVELRLILRADDGSTRGGEIILEEPLVIRPDAALPSIRAQQPDAKPGRYRAQLVGPDGHVYEAGRWFVVQRPLDWVRSTNERRLMNIEVLDANLGPALMATRSRNALLTDRPSEQESSQFLTDPIELTAQLDQEIEALRSGVNPYRNRVGDYWRTFSTGSMHVPVRVYAPPSVNEGKPMPLVIALHGASADEAMWMEGYGAGAIKRLADEHGFLVLSPSTYWVIPNPQAFEGFLQAMSIDYDIDRSRVYVIGHSMGAVAAVGMGMRHPGEIAGAVLIAGGNLEGVRRICPTLVIAAEADPIFPAGRLEKMAKAARERGLPVEFKLVNDAGHILIAGEALPVAIEWMLAQTPTTQRSRE